VRHQKTGTQREMNGRPGGAGTERGKKKKKKKRGQKYKKTINASRRKESKTERFGRKKIHAFLTILRSPGVAAFYPLHWERRSADGKKGKNKVPTIMSCTP